MDFWLILWTIFALVFPVLLYVDAILRHVRFLKKELRKMSAQVDAVVAAIKAEDDAIKQVLAYQATIPQQITDAVAKALAGGATAAELAPLTAVAADVQAQTTAMLAALPPAPPSP